MRWPCNTGETGVLAGMHIGHGTRRPTNVGGEIWINGMLLMCYGCGSICKKLSHCNI